MADPTHNAGRLNTYIMLSHRSGLLSTSRIGWTALGGNDGNNVRGHLQMRLFQRLAPAIPGAYNRHDLPGLRLKRLVYRDPALFWIPL